MPEQSDFSTLVDQEPRRVTGKYAAGAEESGPAKAFVSLNWVLEEEPLDLETQLAWGFLDYLLLGTSAAPLRKALNDSGLGEALIGGGLMDELRQPIFSIGLKGVNPPDAAKVCMQGCACTCAGALRFPVPTAQASACHAQ